MQTSFTWVDYFVFATALVLSALVGVYYGLIKKQNTAADYLLGGKEMSIFPIATSIISSSLSGMMLISFPADIYRYGITFCMTIPLMIVVIISSYYIVLPIFYKMEVTSIYEYLTVRFDNKVGAFASTLYTIHQILYLPIVIYVPALALSQATGLSVHYITPVVCSVCIFYTTLGGMKGIVLTDSIQFGAMVGSLILVVITGVWSSGGFGPVLEKAYAGKRLDISFEFTLLKRDTFWTGLLLYFAMMHHYGFNQSFVQKCLSLPSFKTIKTTLILVTIGTILVKFCLLMCGLLIFAKYFDCDPLKSKIVTRYDQLMPMYVMENVNFIPGFSGLFLSAIFSTSLSTLSAVMNSLAATLYQDFLSGFVPKDTSQERVSLYLKLLVVCIGVFSTVSVFIVEKLGSLIALAFSLGSMTGGPLLGLFLAAMLFPKVHTKGAFYGGITSLVLMSVLVLTTQWYKFNGVGRDPILPVSTDGCNITTTLIGASHIASEEEPFFIFKLSFYAYTMTGGFIGVISSLMISHFTKRDKPLNEDCISPIVHMLFGREEKSEYNTIDKARELIIMKE